MQFASHQNMKHKKYQKMLESDSKEGIQFIAQNYPLNQKLVTFSTPNHYAFVLAIALYIMYYK